MAKIKDCNRQNHLFTEYLKRRPRISAAANFLFICFTDCSNDGRSITVQQRRQAAAISVLNKQIVHAGLFVYIDFCRSQFLRIGAFKPLFFFSHRS